jgi:hypothetical protein
MTRPDRAESRGNGEWGDGLSLREHVRRHGALDENSLHQLAVVSAATLASLHEVGLVLGDLGPDTIVLARGGPRVVGADLARREHPVAPVAPVADGQPTTGQTRDLLAWAVMIVFAAGGVLPRATAAPDGDAARSCGSAVPGALRAVLQECMTDSSRRPTARQVLQRLSPPRDADDGVPEAPGGPDSPTVSISTQALDGRADVDVLHAQPLAGARPRRPVPDPASTAMMPLWPAPDTGIRSRRRRRSGRAAAFWILLLVAVAVTATVGRRELAMILRDAAVDRQSPPVVSAQRSMSDLGVTQALAPLAPPATSAALIGRWRGALAQSQSPTPLTVRVTLSGGGGQIVLPGIGCTGTLTVTRTVADGIVFRDLLVTDAHGACARSGTVTITRLAAGGLGLRWVNDATPFNSATGVLQPD